MPHGNEAFCCPTTIRQKKAHFKVRYNGAETKKASVIHENNASQNTNTLMNHSILLSHNLSLQ